MAKISKSIPFFKLLTITTPSENHQISTFVLVENTKSPSNFAANHQSTERFVPSRTLYKVVLILEEVGYIYHCLLAMNLYVCDIVV